MTARVHTFDVREGGTFRVSLSYDDPSATGIPDDIPREDNELGTRMALDNLARLVEGPHARRPSVAE